MGAAKKWFTTTCKIHGDAPKGQPFKEVKVPEPTGKSLGRHRTECPYCKGDKEKK